MFKKSLFCVAILLASFSPTTSIQGAYMLRDGKIKNVKDVATVGVHEHHAAGLSAFQEKKWNEAAAQFRIVVSSFPTSTYAHEALYYLGVCYYNLGEFDFSNGAIDAYLKSQNNPHHFENAIKIKFDIAESFRKGARRRLLGWSQMPKWASGYRMALEIYDEVIISLPSHDLAAKALYSKAMMLQANQQYREAETSLQMLLKRFPKHELTPDGYLALSQLYLERCKTEFQNPDLLTLADINLRRFKEFFPSEEKLKEVEKNVLLIKECHAEGLYATGLFYERTKRPKASVLYYASAMNQFPQTKVAGQCQERLIALNEYTKDILTPDQKTPAQDVAGVD